MRKLKSRAYTSNPGIPKPDNDISFAGCPRTPFSDIFKTGGPRAKASGPRSVQKKNTKGTRSNVGAKQSKRGRASRAEEGRYDSGSRGWRLVAGDQAKSSGPDMKRVEACLKSKVLVYSEPRLPEGAPYRLVCDLKLPSVASQSKLLASGHQAAW
ncbi:hypothetical protein NL676_038159 [Syzygium grande]|nr:hypothetical protein NL676_038159 [Syzygium grande]